MSVTPSLDEAERACAAYGHEPSRCGFDLSRDLVMAVREGKHVRPDLVLKYGQYLLKSHASRLGDGVWAMYEQVYMALLQYGRRRKKSDGANDLSDELRLAGEYCTILCGASLSCCPSSAAAPHSHAPRRSSAPRCSLTLPSAHSRAVRLASRTRSASAASRR